jgi:hypothetical protein
MSSLRVRTVLAAVICNQHGDIFVAGRLGAEHMVPLIERLNAWCTTLRLLPTIVYLSLAIYSCPKRPSGFAGPATSSLDD